MDAIVGGGQGLQVIIGALVLGFQSPHTAGSACVFFDSRLSGPSAAVAYYFRDARIVYIEISSAF